MQVQVFTEPWSSLRYLGSLTLFQHRLDLCKDIMEDSLAVVAVESRFVVVVNPFQVSVCNSQELSKVLNLLWEPCLAPLKDPVKCRLNSGVDGQHP